MPCAKQFTRQIAKKSAVLLITSAILSACGGGGGSRVETSADTLPNSFEPSASITGIEVGEQASFDAFTVADIDAQVPIVISDGGSFSLDGGDTFVSSGNVENGDEVIVRVTAADEFETESNAVLSIGTGTATFTVISELEDINPEAFDLGDAVAVNTAEDVGQSGFVTIEGINSSAPISIENGEYRIGDDGDFTSEAGTIENGEQVQVRATAATTAATDVVATLSIGDQSDGFTVTTEDIASPTSEIIFPTPTTMTDGTSVTLRGTADDDFGPIARISVTVTTDEGDTQVDSDVIEAGEGDDFSQTWSVNVDLGSEKVNTISVEAIDASGNVQDEPTVITMLQTDEAVNTNFPEGSDVFIGEIGSRGMVLDKQNSRILILSNVRSPGDIIAIDISKGQRTTLLENSSDMVSAGPMRLMEDTRQLLVMDINDRSYYLTDLDSPELVQSFLVDIFDMESPSRLPFGFVFDEAGENMIAADQFNRVLSIDLDDGAVTIISDNVTNASAPLFQTPLDLAINNTAQSILVTDSTAFDESANGMILEVSIADGSRSNIDVQDGADFGRPFGIEWLVDYTEAIVTSRSVDGRNEAGQILKLDLNDNTLITLASNDIPENAANSIQVPQFLSVDKEQELAYIVSGAGFADSRSSILVLDATTGERVVLTRSVTFIP